MTDFASLYYTDCLPGQGLRGGAGFQFQAVSAGVGHDEMALVQRSSLYEAPAGWMRERRPVSEYPPSLTHTVDGVFATARGIYLGAEANGAREGNQFTHAVTTTDPDAYGETRPAQLWDAPWWVSAPADSTRCDPVPAAPEHGPWGRDAVREWVLGKPDGQEWLTAVFSALDRIGGPDEQRIAFVAEEAAEVLGWLAAGTLLLPQARALRISFRVFATNPQYSRHDVIALHPDWAGPYADVRRDGEFVVFNLASGEHSEIEPTPAALHWVPRFLRDDPYDVVDAVEWADGAARTRGEPENAGDRVASSVVSLGEAVEDPADGDALAAWLVAQPLDTVEDSAEELVAAALAAARGVEALRALDVVALRLRVPSELANEVRQALFAAEVAAVLAGAVEVITPQWKVAPTPAMTAEVERAAEVVRPEQMNTLLVLAAGFGVRPDAAAFRHGADRFVTWWADHPDAEVTAGLWANTEQMLHLLRDVLSNRRDAGPAWWQLLWPLIADPTSPLDSSLAAAAVEQGDAKVRSAVFDRVLELATGDVQAYQALFSRAKPTTDEMLKFVNRYDRTSREVAEAMFAALGNVGRQELDVLGKLADRGHLPKNPVQRRLAADDVNLRKWLENPSIRGVAEVAEMTGVPVIARAKQIAHVLLENARAEDAAALVRSAGPALQTVLYHELPLRWAQWGPNSARAVALAHLVDGPGQHAKALYARLRSFAGTATDDQVEEVATLPGLLGRREADKWRDLVERARQGHQETRKASEKAAKAPKTPKAPKKKPEKASLWPFGRKGGE